MASSGLLYPPATTISRPSNSTKFQFYPPTQRKFHYDSLKCKSSSSSSSSSWITDFDLYDLLGIDSSSDQSQIKIAYRSLQKRCHPDIAGPSGHDMAIILNQVYSILSDPNSRSAYDKEQEKIEEFRGYTGKPIYSRWCGSENEEKAVFVDEVKCVGCLKCALFAKNTFAIESVYGRARVVAQWADPQHKIEDAIQSCPVDCISIVERSNLAALEFLMSKQPRGNVRMSTGNAVGTRVSNIFVDIKKFQSRFHEANSKRASKQDSRDSSLQGEARLSAIQTIRSISNWWYWKSPKNGSTSGESCRNLTLIAGKSTHRPSMDKLRDAVSARQKAKQNVEPLRPMPSNHDEYWTPSSLALPAPNCSSNTTSLDSLVTIESEVTSKENNPDDNADDYDCDDNRRDPIGWAFPVGTATVAAIIVKLQGGQRLGSGGGGGGVGLEEHVAGSLALEIVNSSWLQTILAGVTWYLIGMAVVELVEVFRSSKVGNGSTKGGHER